MKNGTSYYAEDELKDIGLKECGKNVFLSKKASLYGIQDIVIGDNVRIDDYCIISGNVTIGSFVHIGAYTALYGGIYGIKLDNFVTLSSRVAVYSETDDYYGESLTNPLIQGEFRKTSGGKVVFEKHVLIGSGCTVLPDVTIGAGSAVGAMSLVRESLPEWGVYAGIPSRKINNRKKEILKLEKAYLSSLESDKNFIGH